MTSAVTIAVRVVGAGIQHGRDADMADMRTIVDLWITNVSSTIVATRGERLALMRTHFSGSDQGPEHSSPRSSASSRLTPTSGSSPSSHSISTTSTPPSQSSTPGTSPAKRPLARARGRSSQRPMSATTGASFLPRRRTG